MKEYKKLKEDTQKILMNLKRINFENGDFFCSSATHAQIMTKKLN